MQRSSPRIRRTFLAALVVGGVLAAQSFAPAQYTAASRMSDTSTTGATVPPAAGTDLAALDTESEHYTQAATSAVDLQLYNSPVGNPGASGWTLRNTQLTAASDGTAVPANLPFSLHIATTTAAPALASITGEDGVTLGLGLATVAGATPAPATGQINGNAVTYPVAVMATTNLSPTAGIQSTSPITPCTSPTIPVTGVITDTATATSGSRQR